MGRPFFDLTGQVFGNLVAISMANKDGGRTKWKCLCRLCNKTVVVFQRNLHRGKISCDDCSRPKFNNLGGKKFGALIVENENDEPNPRIRWNCTCSLCGSKSVVPSSRIIKCPKYCRYCTGFEGVGDLGRTYWNRMVRGAKRRKIPIECTIEEAWELFKRQGGRCAISGIKLTIRMFGSKITASLDRIDSKQSYKLGNIQWVHKRINLMKLAMSDSELIDLCNQIARRSKDTIGLVHMANAETLNTQIPDVSLKVIDNRCLEDLSGRIYGKWLVVGKSVNDAKWVCRCECGTIREIKRQGLVSGRTRSCGCGKMHKEITGTRWGAIKKSARQRAISFDLTIVEAWNQFERQGRLCRFTGLSIGFKPADCQASMDRIRSSDGYNSTNIQWVDSRVNMMKGSMEDQMFIRWCIVISKHQKSKEAKQ